MNCAAMDSDDEMILAILEEKAAADAMEAEHLTIISHLMHLQAVEAKPRRGGSKKGRRKSKSRVRAEGYAMLYKDYFADQPVQDALTFRRRFRMNKGLFMRIVIGVRNSTTPSSPRRAPTECLGFRRYRSARPP